MWRSLVAHLFWEQRVAGSNPVIPTIAKPFGLNVRAALFVFTARPHPLISSQQETMWGQARGISRPEGAPPMLIRGHNTHRSALTAARPFPQHLSQPTTLRAAQTLRRRSAAVIILALTLSGCSSDDPDSSLPSPSAPDTQASSGPSRESRTDVDPGVDDPEVVAQNLQAPWSVAFYKDTVLVSERDSGRILELDDQRPAQAREVATVAGVSASGEGGLLGLSVHGDSLYAYSTTETDNRIQRFPLKHGSDGVELGAPETIVDGIARPISTMAVDWPSAQTESSMQRSATPATGALPKTVSRSRARSCG